MEAASHDVDSWHLESVERNAYEMQVQSASQRASHEACVSPVVVPSSLRPSQPGLSGTV